MKLVLVGSAAFCDPLEISLMPNCKIYVIHIELCHLWDLF